MGFPQVPQPTVASCQRFCRDGVLPAGTDRAIRVKCYLIAGALSQRRGEVRAGGQGHRAPTGSGRISSIILIVIPTVRLRVRVG
ncbi:hypothetical protein NQZ68_014469 [Dissostichus eleginoides]|nr:hypothetical protein NQZ68_014469 [Dissostichus eleginoides]